jgi:hypothetical protein
MGPEDYACGLRVYKQTSAGMEKIRQDIFKRPDAYERALGTLIEIPDMRLLGERFKRDRYPDQGGMCLELLNMRSFHAAYERPVSQSVFSEALREELAAGFRVAGALYGLLKGALTEG